ncbi:MAG: ATP-binding protein [Candidatus Hydrogenedentes bacterium]|nr:ATP-binding protein [Candidatus Hydrogenedentota bacterium]
MSDYKERQELEQCISVYAMDVLNDTPVAPPAGLFPPPPRDVCAGEIPLGRVKYGGKLLYEVGLRKNELLRHVGIYGSSGAGKSNGLALILDGLTKLGIHWWLVDYKRTFRSLVRSPGYENLLVFTAGDSQTAPFAFNPLIPPPGTSTDVWSKKMTGVISHAYCQGAGSESLLVTAIQEAYSDGAKHGRWPTFKDVYTILEDMPARGRRSLWMDSARRAMQSLTTGNAAEVFCSERPVDLVKLLDRSMICEIELLSVAEATLLSEAVLVFVLQHHMQNNRNREALAFMLFIEEAHHLLRSPPGLGDGSEPVIHSMLRLVRELGIGVCLATQDAAAVPPPVFGNQATTIAFHTKHQRDVMSTAQAMLLKDDAKDELGRLPVGDAIIRLPRCFEPLQISVDYRPIAKGTVTDTHLAQHMAMVWSSSDMYMFQAPPANPSLIPGIPPPDNRDSISMESASPQDTARDVSTASPPPTTPDIQSVETNSKPTDLERLMLQDLLTQPFSGVVDRIRRLGFSRRKATAVLRTLEEHGFIKPTFIYNGTALLKLFDLTEDGSRLCDGLNLGTPPPRSEGGVVHRFMVNRAANRLRETGWKARTEYRVADDLVVDIHAESKQRLMAVLVETGKSNISRNLKRTLAAGYEEVLIIAPTPEIAANLRRLVAGLAQREPPVMSLAEFLASEIATVEVAENVCASG